jgi:hypothetical protein
MITSRARARAAMAAMIGLGLASSMALAYEPAGIDGSWSPKASKGPKSGNNRRCDSQVQRAKKKAAHKSRMKQKGRK